MSEIIVNARRLMCPMPVIRAQDKACECQPGDQLRIECTDPGAINDIPAWCRLNGHEVVNIESDDAAGEYVITFVVGASS